MPLYSIKTIDQINFDFYSVALCDNGLMCIRVEGNREIDVENVVEIVNAIEKLGNKKIFPLLVVVGEYTLPTSEARAYIATPESDPYACAEAYVVKSFSQKLVGNVFLSFNKPVRPTKIFNTEEKAIEWLKGFL